MLLVKASHITETCPDITGAVGKDLFSKLIPLSVHEAASQYSEEKAKLLRNNSELIQNADNLMKETLDSLEISKLLTEVFFFFSEKRKSSPTNH